MKRLSINAERRNRLKSNRLKIKQRFRMVDGVHARVELTFVAKLQAYLNYDRLEMLNYKIFATVLIVFALFSFEYKQFGVVDSSKLVCKPEQPEIQTLANAKDLEVKVPSQLQIQLSAIVKNAPMSSMVEEIAKKERPVAAYLMGIAMKESKYGTFAPKKDGKDCFNYWGYRGKENTTKSGYSCFDSPSHAVTVVGGRIEDMLKFGPRTPAQMISWKCGSTCAGHDPVSVAKWISDVSINYYLIVSSKELARK